MLPRPWVWIVFLLLSAGAAIFTFRNFSTAFPLVSIELKMDRAAAIHSGRTLADKFAWPPAGSDQAAEFGGDQEVQNFIELEGGGKQELGRILKEKTFALYTWRVRHFKQGDAHETLIRFTPDGVPYGFYVKLPDQEPGDTKAVSEAQQIAESAAQRDWNIDFGRYRVVESSKDVKPGGRTDHAFVYERQDQRLGEGRYRLRLMVGGDKLTELTHFVQIPEAFTRRHEQMRSANDAIGAFSQIVTFGLYILGFCGVGLFFMIRYRWVLWRQPLAWALLIALLMALQQLNSWPLVWMRYDTALPASGFAIRQFLRAASIFGVFSILLTVSFMAAETLSRRAFPHHVQFWKVWSLPVSASKLIFGETLAGYLLVAPFFVYEIALYFFAQERLGWWTPSDTLLNPDMFATYVPSLAAIVQAAQAGFWEECLFRAAPLASAALIGDKFGKRRAFIGAGMILQAVVFASGHAGYANQPAYARVVELIIPSFVFGGVYLAFGLLPGIVLHFTYDTVWMSLPLFVSSTGRAHLEQAIVAVVVLVPLWVILANRIRAGSWTEVSGAVLNGAWNPGEIPEASPEIATAQVQTFVSPVILRALPIIGVIGLVLWIAASPFRLDVPPIQITRSEAERQARQALNDRGVQLDQSWRVLSRIEGQPGEQNRFVRQKAGRSVYERLLGTYLTPPHWFVRFARFQGDVAERAEEFHAFIDGNGRAFRLTHDLPEARPGKGLTEEEARKVATDVVHERLGSHAASLKEISAEASKKPARTDWTFVFKDTEDYGLPEGEPRISIEIAGDEVVDTGRYVYVPEEWSRNERRQQNLPEIFRAVCAVLLIGIVVSASIIGIVRWSRRRNFSAGTFYRLYGLLFLISVVNVLNNWPVQASQASTAQPLALQTGIVIAVSLVFGIFSAAALALAGGVIAANPAVSTSSRADITAGVSLGLALAGIGAVARYAVPSMSPLWGNLGPASTFLPILTAALSPLTTFAIQSIILLIVFLALVPRTRAVMLLVLVGLVMTGSTTIETIPSWLILGATTGIVLLLAYLAVFRHQPIVAIVTAATLVILSTLRDGIQHPYSSALIGSVVASVLVAVAAWVWFRGSVRVME